MASDRYHGKPRSGYLQLGSQWSSALLFSALTPDYTIDSSQMRPVTKITIFGIRLAIVVLVVYWLAMFLGTHLPASVGDISPHVSDKHKHFSAFFILGGLLCYVTNSPRWLLRFTSIGLVGMAYAAVDEITQLLVPGRVADPADFLADALGLWTAIAIYLCGKGIHHVWTSRTAEA